LIHTYPWLQGPYMAFTKRHILGSRINREWQYQNRILFDLHVAQAMKPCDVFVGLSGSALRSGQTAKRMGAKYVCDRGSSHIRTQDALLAEEHDIWGVPYENIDPRTIELEEAEYAESDCITVPSTFNARSFQQHGIHEKKIQRIPYGVNLENFNPQGQPQPGRFDILFVGGMSLRKGVPYLLQAYKALEHKNKSLTFVGAPSMALIDLMRARNLWPEDANVMGALPQKQLKFLMSKSHVLVLPSVEEGLALVQAQAMACGCPVVATAHTGAEDLLTDGVEGRILPIRRGDLLTAALQELADHPSKRDQFSRASLERVRGAGGWRDYGNLAIRAYRQLIAPQAL